MGLMAVSYFRTLWAIAAYDNAYHLILDQDQMFRMFASCNRGAPAGI